MAEKHKVLLVEDDEYLIGIYATKFELKGWEVLKAGTGEEGLAMIKKEKPDLVLADILMPGISGFELIKKVKADKDIKDIPIVILSNLGTKDDVNKGLKLGAADYIIKVHLTPTEIFERVKKLLK